MGAESEGMYMTVGELREIIEDLDNDVEVYLAVYQRYTPPEDRVTDYAEYVNDDGEITRLYLEGTQTGNYVPDEIRVELGW